jgi:hypothetical protein
MAMHETAPETASFTGEDFNRGRLADAARAVERHPRFEEALAAFCEGVVASFEGDHLTNRVMGQAGRFAMLALLIARGAGRDAAGVTIGELITLLARRRLASPGRTHAMVRYMRDVGAVVASEAAGDGREKPLVPTAILMGQAARWIERSLGPAECVTALPEPAAVLVRRSGFVARYFVEMAAPYAAEGFILYDDFPEVEALMQHAGGYVLMIETLRTACRTDDRIVADLPSSGLAARLVISRGQVRRVLRRAEENGWLRRAAGDRRTVELAPAFVACLRRWVATELAWGGDLARRASRSSPADARAG